MIISTEYIKRALRKNILAVGNLQDKIGSIKQILEVYEVFSMIYLSTTNIVLDIKNSVELNNVMRLHHKYLKQYQSAWLISENSYESWTKNIEKSISLIYNEKARVLPSDVDICLLAIDTFKLMDAILYKEVLEYENVIATKFDTEANIDHSIQLFYQEENYTIINLLYNYLNCHFIETSLEEFKAHFIKSEKFNKIIWKGTNSEIIALFHQMLCDDYGVLKGLNIKNDNIPDLIARHFLNSDGVEFNKNSLKGSKKRHPIKIRTGPVFKSLMNKLNRYYT